MVKKSVAIIGEGETEWFYFESMRIAKRYPFQLKPTFPKHSDWKYIFKQASYCLREGYDKVVCLVDMDVVYSKNEMQAYHEAKAKIEKARVSIIETNPCTEFWFLLHFLPSLSTKSYINYEEVVIDLRKYLPKYDKTKKYFQKVKLYEYLTTYGDLKRAINYAEKLLNIAQATSEDFHAYTQIHKVLALLDEYNKESEERKLSLD